MVGLLHKLAAEINEERNYERQYPVIIITIGVELNPYVSLCWEFFEWDAAPSDLY